MKIYTGWVLNIDGKEQTIIGSCTIRKSTTYVLKDSFGDKSGINRDVLIKRIQDGSVTFVKSVYVK